MRRILPKFKNTITKTKLGYELRFYNFIIHNIGKIISKNGFKCKGCKKLVIGNFTKHDHSFDIFHPQCIKKSEIKMVFYDELSKKI